MIIFVPEETDEDLRAAANAWDLADWEADEAEAVEEWDNGDWARFYKASNLL